YTSPDYRPAANSIALAGASFTDAIIAANTATSNATALSTIPSSVCIGNSETSLQSYSFVPSTTITPGYCMLGWSAQTGVAISNTADINPTFTVSTLGTFTIN